MAVAWTPTDHNRGRQTVLDELKLYAAAEFTEGYGFVLDEAPADILEDGEVPDPSVDLSPGELTMLREKAAVAVDWDSTFAINGHIFVKWLFHGIHAAKGSTALSFGFERTFNRVSFEVFSVGTAVVRDDASLLRCTFVRSRWDSIAALSQIGVQAVGRPVVSIGRDELRERQ